MCNGPEDCTYYRVRIQGGTRMDIVDLLRLSVTIVMQLTEYCVCAHVAHPLMEVVINWWPTPCLGLAYTLEVQQSRTFPWGLVTPTAWTSSLSWSVLNTNLLDIWDSIRDDTASTSARTLPPHVTTAHLVTGALTHLNQEHRQLQLSQSPPCTWTWWDDRIIIIINYHDNDHSEHRDDGEE